MLSEISVSNNRCGDDDGCIGFNGSRGVRRVRQIDSSEAEESDKVGAPLGDTSGIRQTPDAFDEMDDFPSRMDRCVLSSHLSKNRFTRKGQRFKYFFIETE